MRRPDNAALAELQSNLPTGDTQNDAPGEKYIPKDKLGRPIPQGQHNEPEDGWPQASRDIASEEEESRRDDGDAYERHTQSIASITQEESRQHTILRSNEQSGRPSPKVKEKAEAELARLATKKREKNAKRPTNVSSWSFIKQDIEDGRLNGPFVTAIVDPTDKEIPELLSEREAKVARRREVQFAPFTKDIISDGARASIDALLIDSGISNEGANVKPLTRPSSNGVQNHIIWATRRFVGQDIPQEFPDAASILAEMFYDEMVEFFTAKALASVDLSQSISEPDRRATLAKLDAEILMLDRQIEQKVRERRALGHRQQRYTSNSLVILGMERPAR